ncbi:F-box protein At1g30790-like [Rutidosis leptorrhynchoides]|uniref:F-box protein At1g30790-like n=1 Tax=Rutidosis leptorrhynchoides TaxID=125765 RepID=UPI003A9A28B3
MKKLSIKPLMRFRCLSKCYNNIIGSSSFTAAHEPSHPDEPRLLIAFSTKLLSGQQFFTTCSEGGSSSHLMTMMSSNSRYVAPSVNGFVCLDYGIRSTICNLTLNKSIKLPFIAPPSIVSSTFFCVNSLRYDSYTNQYKILNTWTYPTPDGADVILEEDEDDIDPDDDYEWAELRNDTLPED